VTEHSKGAPVALVFNEIQVDRAYTTLDRSKGRESLKLSDLGQFVAPSYGTQYKFHHELLEGINEFGDAEKERLRVTMDKSQFNLQ
jgi:hypothetical protein